MYKRRYLFIKELVFQQVAIISRPISLIKFNRFLLNNFKVNNCLITSEHSYFHEFFAIKKLTYLCDKSFTRGT